MLWQLVPALLFLKVNANLFKILGQAAANEFQIQICCSRQSNLWSKASKLENSIISCLRLTDQQSQINPKFRWTDRQT